MRDPVHEIPDLQYLVSGVMTAFTNRQFHLEISLLDQDAVLSWLAA